MLDFLIPDNPGMIIITALVFFLLWLTHKDDEKDSIQRAKRDKEEKETLGKETATLMEKVAELQQQIEELKKNQPASIFNDGKQSPEIEKLIKQQETARDKANENIEKIKQNIDYLNFCIQFYQEE